MVKKAIEKVEQKAEQSELTQVLEQWREFLLREGALEETGSALSVKKLGQRVPEVKQLSPEHLAAIRQMQKEVYASKANERQEQFQQAVSEQAEVAEQETGDDLESKRKLLLKHKALESTGTALSTKRVKEKVPGGKDLSPEDLQAIKNRQRYVYERTQKPALAERQLAETSTPEAVKTETSKFVKGVEYTDGIFVGSAKNGDLLFLNPENKKYLERDDLERIIDLGYGSRISTADTDEDLVASAADSDWAKPVTTEAADQIETTEDEEAEDEEIETLSDDYIDQLRLWLLAQGVLDKRGNMLRKTISTADGKEIRLDQALTLEERSRILQMQQEQAARPTATAEVQVEDDAEDELDTSDDITEIQERSPAVENSREQEDDGEFVLENWYSMMVDGQPVKAKYLGDQGNLMKFMTAEGDTMKSMSFSSLLQRGERYAFRVRPEEADAMRFAAAEKKAA